MEYESFPCENNKIKPVIVETMKKTYEEEPTQASFQVSLDNWFKDLNKNLIIKPVLLFPLKEMTIDIEKRKYAFDLDCKETFKYEYRIELPNGYYIEHLPESVKLSTDLADFELQYILESNYLVVRQLVATKEIVIQKESFQAWTDFIKAINKHYNQSVVFTKQL